MLKKRYQHVKFSRWTAFPSAKSFPLPRRERGAFAVMTAVLIIAILGVCGMAIDFGRMYNRKAELQTFADAIALAAAAELDGTEQGITRAVAVAGQAAAANPAYAYSSSLITWSSSAIKFSSASSGGTWVDENTAKGQAQNLFYVQVDTSELDGEQGHVDMLLLPVISSAMSAADIRSRAVAGRSSVNILPLAICAMPAKLNESIVARGEELVEYGFRRGVSYNLMNLNPIVNTNGATYLVNPVAPPGTKGKSVVSKPDVIAPFVCTGTMAMSQVTGGDITVESGFPLGDVFPHLNSRFGTYTAPCTSANAPPDTNVKPYTVANTISWMTAQPAAQSADKRTTDTKLFTIAHLDQADIPTNTAPGMYGPLWIYARAAKYSSYISTNKSEPAAGYATFDAATDWSKLYTPGSPVLAGTYPPSNPYKTYTVPPPGSLKGVPDRRVLNIPLLRCPVPAGSPASAEVLAVARFYMTIPATKDDLFGEFAGLVRPETLTGQVELYP